MNIQNFITEQQGNEYSVFLKQKFMNKEKLISLLLKKQTYKDTQEVQNGILNLKEEAVKVSVHAIRQILQTQYNAEAKLYAIRYLKDCFEKGNPIFISKTETQILPFLAKIVEDSMDSKAYLKYAGSYTKKQELEKFKSIIVSLFTMCKECIKNWASMIKDKQNQFVQTFQTLKSKGVTFQAQDKYFRSQNIKFFYQNCEKNKLPYKPIENKKTAQLPKQQAVSFSKKTINQPSKFKDPKISSVINESKALFQKEKVEERDIVKIQNKFNEALNYYLQNTVQFDQNYMTQCLKQFQQLKDTLSARVQSQKIKEKQRLQDEIMEEQRISKAKLVSIHIKEENQKLSKESTKKKFEADLSSIQQKNQEMSIGNSPLKEIAEKIKFKQTNENLSKDTFTGNKETASIEAKIINKTDQKIKSLKVTELKPRQTQNRIQSNQKQVSFSDQNHKFQKPQSKIVTKKQLNKQQEQYQQKVVFQQSPESSFQQTQNQSFQKKKVARQMKNFVSIKQIDQKKVNQYQNAIQEKYRQMQRNIAKLKQEENKLLLKLRASVSIDSHNQLKKQLFEEKKQRNLLQQQLNQLQQQINHVKKNQDINQKNTFPLDKSLSYSNNVVIRQQIPLTYEQNQQRKQASFHKQEKDFLKKNHLEVIGRVHQDYIQNLTHPSNLSSWLNDNNILLFKKAVLNKSRTFFINHVVTINQQNLNQSKQNEILTIHLNFTLKAKTKFIPKIKYQNTQQIDLWTKPVQGQNLVYNQQIAAKMCGNPLKIIKCSIKVEDNQSSVFLLPIMLYNFLRFESFIKEQFNNIYDFKHEEVIKSKVFTLDNRIIQEIDDFNNILQHCVIDGKKINFCMSETNEDHIYMNQIQILKNQKAIIRILPIPKTQSMLLKARQLMENMALLFSQKL